MIFNLSDEADRERFCEVSRSLLDGRRVVDVKRVFPNRTLNQNSYLHLLLSYFADETGYTLEEVKHDIFKKIVNADLFTGDRMNKRGEMVTYIRSTSEISTQEMSEAIERFRDYSSVNVGLYLPSADEHDHLMEIRKNTDKNKYL